MHQESWITEITMSNNCKIKAGGNTHSTSHSMDAPKPRVRPVSSGEVYGSFVLVVHGLIGALARRSSSIVFEFGQLKQVSIEAGSCT